MLLDWKAPWQWRKSYRPDRLCQVFGSGLILQFCTGAASVICLGFVVLVWKQIVHHLRHVYIEDLSYLFIVQLSAVRCSKPEAISHGTESVPRGYVSACVTWLPHRAVLHTFRKVIEDGREHILQAHLHRSWQASLSKQRCLQQSFGLWI